MALPSISFIIPLHNNASTVEEAVLSALNQAYGGSVEACVHDDGSSDGGAARVAALAAVLDATLHTTFPGPRRVVLTRGAAHGPGFARNRAVDASSGEYLCMLDADDVAAPHRASCQLEAALAAPRGPRRTLVGGGFTRLPADATTSYSQWANGLKDAGLVTEQWRECTLLQPTWFMHRAVFLDMVGGYDEVLPACVEQRKGGNSDDGVVGAAAAPKEAAATPTAPPGSGTELAATLSTAVASLPVPPSAHSGAPCCSAAWLAAPPRRLSAGEVAVHTYTPFPEDPIFWHRALWRGVGLATTAHDRPPVIVYRFSTESQTWRISRAQLLRVKAALFEARFLAGLPDPTASVASVERPRSSAENMTTTAAGYAENLTTTAAGTTASPSPAGALSRAPFPWAAGFAIWGAGRDGKEFYNALSPRGRACVVAFLEIDPKKIGQHYPQVARQQGAGRKAAHARLLLGGKRPRGEGEKEEGGVLVGGSSEGAGGGACGGVAAASSTGGAAAEGTTASIPACPYCSGPAALPAPIPILHFSAAAGKAWPVACCVALSTGGDALRANVATLHRTEGVDFWYLT